VSQVGWHGEGGSARQAAKKFVLNICPPSMSSSQQLAMVCRWNSPWVGYLHLHVRVAKHQQQSHGHVWA